MNCFNAVLKRGKSAAVIQEIVLQSRLEFNVEEEAVPLYEDIVKEEE